MIDLVEEYKKIIASDPSRAGDVGTNDVAAMSVRELRDRLLKESDWVMSGDIPAATQASYVEYRKALRELPHQTGFPLDAVWPPKPTGEA